MKILKIWIFSSNGQQLFFKEYDNFQDNIIANLLNMGVIYSFVNFFNIHIVRRNCDLILFDDVLFTFHYMLNTPVKFTTLIVTRIDKKINLDVQSKVLLKVTKIISNDFYECYKEVMDETQYNSDLFEPFSIRCENLIHSITNELNNMVQINEI